MVSKKSKFNSYIRTNCFFLDSTYDFMKSTCRPLRSHMQIKKLWKLTCHFRRYTNRLRVLFDTVPVRFKRVFFWKWCKKLCLLHLQRVGPYIHTCTYMSARKIYIILQHIYFRLLTYTRKYFGNFLKFKFKLTCNHGCSKHSWADIRDLKRKSSVTIRNWPESFLILIELK